ncbi:NHL repeat-containing protein [Kangiella shandongensis]|uniref:hypothetical protein n=1 Tax=Kangiella shandongensis TaxID=2763258 RepID=UPI001CBB23AA|nr:hypothetical protein [Kangiella shandongensis]
MNKKILIPILAVAFPLTVDAQSLKTGDTVTITNGTFTILDATGYPVFTHQTNSSNFSRDIEVIDNNRVAFWSDDAFSPSLTIFNVTDLSETKYTFPGWSTVNNISYGGLAIDGDQLFMTDMSTSGAEARGIIRFDLNNQAYSRFADHEGYIDVAFSTNGLLYALKDDYWGHLDIIDPTTEEVINSINLDAVSPRGVAVDADGNLYVTEWGGNVLQLDSQGQQLQSITVSNNLNDIDVNASGLLTVTNWEGQLYEVDFAQHSSYLLYTGSSYQMPFTDPVDFTQVAPESPTLQAHSSRKGKWINTTLNWSTAAESVDIYFNGSIIETSSSNVAQYSYSKFISQKFVVCNAGTTDCSQPYIAN